HRPVNALAALPVAEVLLEVTRSGRRTRAVIVIARHRQATRPMALADAEQLGRAGHLLHEAEGRGIAGEEQVVVTPRPYLLGKRREDPLGIAKAETAAQE